MIKNNFFFIKNLQTVVVFGESKIFQDIENINEKLNLKTIFITSSHQSKIIDKKINYKIFNKIDNKTKKYLNNKIDVNQTLFIFISMGARYIFTKHDIINFFKENLINFHGTRLPLDYENYRLEKFKIFYKKIITDIKKVKKFFLKNQINFSGRYNPRLNTIKNGFIN